MNLPSAAPLRSAWESRVPEGGRLIVWILLAVALHAAAHLLFEVRYPEPMPARISEATLYVVPPGSPEARRLAPFLEAQDPAIFAVDRSRAPDLPRPAMPTYQPSYAAGIPELAPLPDTAPPVLPPLPARSRPVPMPADTGARPAPAIVEDTRIAFSASLAARAPELPAGLPADFVARPGDQLAPTTFLLAVDAEGRVRHRLREGATQNATLEDAVSRYVGTLRFRPAPRAPLTWGSVTFRWGLDLSRRELR